MAEDSGLGLRFGGTVAAGAAVASPDEPGQNNEVWDDDNEYYEEKDDDDELPVISIELERLVGYKPSTREEIDSIKKQLIEAMWMRYKSSSSSDNRASEETKEHNNNASEEEGQQRQEEGEPPPDFDDQIKELLDSRVARFCVVEVDDANDSQHQSDAKPDATTTAQNNSGGGPPSTFLEISYPSRVLPPKASGGGDGDKNVLQDTAKLWSDIRGLSYALDDEFDENDGGSKNEPPTFWYHLTEHLEHTGRLLSWKHAMALELREILYRENLHKNHQLWVKEQRTAKLEQLYQVRETLVHRKEVAQTDHDTLALGKETAIRRDMILYDHATKRNQKSGGGGALGGSELSFPEEFALMGLLPKDSQLYEEEDWGGTLDDEDDFDYYNSDYSNYSDEYDDDDDDLSGFSGDEEGGDDHEEDAPLSEQPPIAADGDPAAKEALNEPSDPRIAELEGIGKEPPESIGTTAVPRPFLRRNRKRRKKKARAQRKKELLEAQKKEDLLKRKAHETMLEARHTTNELVLAQTLLNALEKKVKDVEELLENLQEEEWAAEEEAEAAAEREEQQQLQKQQQNKTEMSLLDQILAMILGALPMEPGSKDKERHFRYVKDEHEFIVRGWKEHFGRLPTAFVPSEPLPDNDENDGEGEGTETPGISPATRKLPPASGVRSPTSTIRLSKITPRKTSAGATAAAASATPQEQRMALGIVDNDGDWEDDDN
jgi:hypothetical protein